MTRLVFPGAALSLGVLRLPKEVARHARVARVMPGETVEVLDLAGTVAVGRLVRWEAEGSCQVEVHELLRERGEPPAPLTLALAVLHTQGFDWAVEKATELGVTRIQPLLTARVQGRDHTRRVGRWQRVAEAAVAQCGRCRAPEVFPPLPLAEVLPTLQALLVVADFQGGTLDPWPGIPPAGVAVFVGPEGGFTEQERQALREAGAMGLSLGPRTLRAETAAVAALALVQAKAWWWTK